MTALSNYEPWSTVTGVRVLLANGVEIEIPWAAGVDAQAVLDTITITTYYSYQGLLKRLREEAAGEE